MRARRRSAGLAAAAALAGATLAAAPGTRIPALRAAGGALVAADPVHAADVVIVATGAGGAGALEAADLVRAGVARRAAVFADPPDPVVDREFLRRGVPYEDAAERSLRQLRALGVAEAEIIPWPVTGTGQEAAALREWCASRRLASVVVVTTADHSRRLRRVLRRTMGGQPTRVAVRPARHSQFDPDRWWHTRLGTRIQVIELQKLALDVVLHPLS
jgi:uncharacterized SAM-binding protein YcdF (DUF218 family)